MTIPFLLPLDSPAATLAVAGGKGANLSHLIRGGFPVPAGFIVTTVAYETFLRANDLGAYLAARLGDMAATDLASLEAASSDIRERFGAGRLPLELANALAETYGRVFPDDVPVAVRSSATAEDLPDLSFAGQQDTYLNVSGAQTLQDAVVRCWSSLWTARAIGYRARNGIPQEGVSLAVVVQAMVQAEAAGVLFTANPLNGRRTESAIDATLGLGEALVSGQVEPDHYLVDTAAARVAEKRLGSKTTVAGGEAADRSSIQALPDAAILDLVALGRRVESYFGAPQDIEWTWAGRKLSLVQSRPITSLYPLPEGIDPLGSLRVFASFGAFQGVLDPFTPLGSDALRCFAAAIARLLGYQATWETQGALRVAGDRLWINVTPLLRNGFGRRLLRGALGQVEPGIGEAVATLLDDPRLAVTAQRLSFDVVRRAAPFIVPLAGRFLVSLARPEAARRQAERGVGLTIDYFEDRAAQAKTLRQRLALLDEITGALRKFLLVHVLPRFVPGMVALNQLYRACDDLPGGELLALEVLRGLPHNVTTQMDLDLWAAAGRIQADPAASAAFALQDTRSLTTACLEKRLPPAAQEALDEFLARYGMRGLAEIDLGRPRWRDDPAPVMEAIRSYLQITDPNQAPDAVFARGAVASERAVKRISAELRRTKGIRKAARARWAARRVRALAGLRESPKFTIINLLGLAREALIESAAGLVSAGVLHAEEDIFFLSLAELTALAAAQERGDELEPWGARLQASIDEHRARYEREKRRRQVPRLMLSDGAVFYAGVGGAQAADAGAAGQLVGSPVSPGVVEGLVRVVLSPAGAQLQHGEILVCPGTDPSWTPLFLAAGGLVMEVGGMMTHGSVVAREYGIPAVVGVTKATQRLQTGQRIRVDGAKGTIQILDSMDD